MIHDMVLFMLVSLLVGWPALELCALVWPPARG